MDHTMKAANVPAILVLCAVTIIHPIYTEAKTKVFDLSSYAKSLSKTQPYQANSAETYHELDYRWESVSDEKWGGSGSVYVQALAVHNGNLYVGGRFETIGNRTFNHIGMWDGHAWHKLGDGPGLDHVNDIVIYRDEIYVLGITGGMNYRFTKWDGENWTDLSGLFNGRIFTIAAGNGSLYAGGEFTQAGGVPVNRIAAGDGFNWSAVGSGFGGGGGYGYVNRIAADCGVICAYGAYSLRPVSVWNGTTWTDLVNNVEGILTMEVYDGYLYVGGNFNNIDGIPIHAIGRSNTIGGGGWHQVASSGNLYGYTQINSMYSHEGKFFAGGMMNIDGISFGIARKRGNSWMPLGNGLLYVQDGVKYGGIVTDIVSIGEYLYVGGRFHYAGGKDAINLARYRMITDYRNFSPRTIVTGGIHSSPSWGCAWGDYNGDGEEDLFVANDFGKQNFLFRNNGDGTFTKLKSPEVVQSGRSSASGTWGDMDNDGDLDLFVANRNGENNQLFINNGDGTFTEVANSPVVSDGAASGAAAWADYDNDGFLDLFVANKNGQNNLLYNNNGDGTFTRITEGAVVNDGGNSRGCAWGDYNNDGFIDLFVANNQQENNFLYQNNGDGTFTKVTEGAVVNDAGGSWSGSWGDYDGDGDLDLFVANEGEPNFLYRNNSGMLERVMAREVTAGDHKCRSAAWGDCDKDGDLDLFVGVRGEDSHLYINQGDGQFIKYMVPDGDDVRGAAWSDFDNDGDLDLFVTRNSTINQLYTHADNDNHYVKIKLKGTTSNASGIGAKIFVTAAIDGNSKTQMQEITSQSGTGGQNSMIATFGLKDATSIEKMRVEWPSGIVWESDNVGINQLVVITEPEQDVILTADQNEGNVEIISDVTNTQTGIPENYQLYQNHPNPFNSMTMIKYDLPEAGLIRVAIYDVTGQQVAVLKEGVQSEGCYVLIWDGRDAAGNQMPSGMYIARLTAGNAVHTRKMVLMR